MKCYTPHVRSRINRRNIHILIYDLGNSALLSALNSPHEAAYELQLCAEKIIRCNWTNYMVVKLNVRCVCVHTGKEKLKIHQNQLTQLCRNLQNLYQHVVNAHLNAAIDISLRQWHNIE